MTIAMWWLIAGVLMLTVAATWLFGPFGLAGGGLSCVAVSLLVTPTVPVAKRKDGD